MPSLATNWSKQNVRLLLVLIVLCEHTAPSINWIRQNFRSLFLAEPQDFSFILKELKFISDA